MYQAWISFKTDQADKVQQEFDVKENEDGSVSKETITKVETFTVPKWDNVICTMKYHEDPK